MRRLFFATMALLAGVVAMQAQQVDINNSQNRTEDGFTGWSFGNTTMAQTTVGGVTLQLGIDGSTQGRTLKCEWWKDGVNKYSKLVCDGVGVYGYDTQGNTPQLQSGPAGITLTVSGLAAGEHTLLAYHNNPSGYSGPPLDIYVDGRLQLQGVEQTSRAQQPSQSALSYLRFTAQEGRPVNIVYRTVPDAAVDYTQGYQTTSLFINALVFDRPNPKTTASDPQPAHQDEHADCDEHFALHWTAATSAVRHHVFLGRQPDQLEEIGVTSLPSMAAGRLDPQFTFYWRVDEEDAEGNVYEGDTWMFRPRRLAFPGAEGYGRFAIGGRGGTVYHVTSLDDDPADPQPGTFRYGIAKVKGPRTIVFDVGGVIWLKDRLTCSDKYVTVAGQTAPGRGIMFRGNPLGFSDDAIVRFLRMRLGYKERSDPSGRDGMGINGDHTIMDHCSISWTIDEGFSSRGSKNITLQRTLISEALNVADHPNYGAGTAHGYAATIGGGQMGGLGSSFHHNLLAHNEGRNWSISGGLDGAGYYDGHHDMFNNVVYNWGGRATDGGTHEGQFVGNYYKKGPATTQNFILNAQIEGTGLGSQAYYVSGNIREELNGTKTADKLNDTYKYSLSGGQKLDWTVFQDQPFFPSYATVQTAEEAYQDVLSDVGCNQPELDSHDERMISETLSGTTSAKGSKSGKKGLIDRETDAEGFSGLNINEEHRPQGWDTDEDGIPDWYERLTDTDPAAPNSSHAQDDQFTDLEHYLDWLAQPHFVLKPGEQVSIDLRPFFAGFKDFGVTDDGERATDGFVYRFEGTSMVVASAFEMVKQLTVTVRDAQTGQTMARRFSFACTADDVAAVSAPTSKAPAPSGKTYDLLGRSHEKAQPGLNIQHGRKFLSRGGY